MKITDRSAPGVPELRPAYRYAEGGRVQQAGPPQTDRQTPRLSNTHPVRRTNGDIEALITDNGPGIPVSERERVFERFVRLTHTSPGHRLGLAIARRIARLHGGDLTCDAVGTEAAFTLRIPVRGTAGQDSHHDDAPVP